MSSSFHESRRVFRRRGHTLEFVEPLLVLGVASGMNRQVNVLQNAGLLSPHPSRNRLASARRASISWAVPTCLIPAANAP